MTVRWAVEQLSKESIGILDVLHRAASGERWFVVAWRAAPGH
jgi:hypothetical protein